MWLAIVLYNAAQYSLRFDLDALSLRCIPINTMAGWSLMHGNKEFKLFEYACDDVQIFENCGV